jgi:hypothetical protein
MDLLELIIGAILGALAASATSLGAEAVRVAAHPSLRRAILERVRAGENIMDVIQQYMRRKPEAPPESGNDSDPLSRAA